MLTNRKIETATGHNLECEIWLCTKYHLYFVNKELCCLFYSKYYEKIVDSSVNVSCSSLSSDHFWLVCKKSCGFLFQFISHIKSHRSHPRLPCRQCLYCILIIFVDHIFPLYLILSLFLVRGWKIPTHLLTNSKWRIFITLSSKKWYRY